MPRKPQYEDRTQIQIVLSGKDKAAFEAWCEANSTTMSEEIRRRIEPRIKEGRKLLSSVAQEVSASE